MDLSRNIKAIREAKNIKQIDVAKALDLDPSYYFRLEKRGDKLSIEQLEKIAGALGVSVLELMTGETQEVENNENTERLERRVRELEKWLNDKEEINESRSKIVQSCTYTLCYIFSQIIKDLCHQEEPVLGNVTISDLKTKIEVSYSEYVKNSSSIHERLFPKSKSVGASHALREEDINIIIDRLYKDFNKLSLVSILIASGLLDEFYFEPMTRVLINKLKNKINAKGNIYYEKMIEYENYFWFKNIDSYPFLGDNQ